MYEWYATKIAREWNVPQAGVGERARVRDVDAEYLERFAVQQVGGRDVFELWVPAEELEEFNAHIVDGIRMIARYDTVFEALGPAGASCESFSARGGADRALMDCGGRRVGHGLPCGCLGDLASTRESLSAGLRHGGATVPRVSTRRLRRA